MKPGQKQRGQPCGRVERTTGPAHKAPAGRGAAPTLNRSNSMRTGRSDQKQGSARPRAQGDDLREQQCGPDSEGGGTPIRAATPYNHAPADMVAWGCPGGAGGACGWLWGARQAGRREQAGTRMGLRSGAAGHANEFCPSAPGSNLLLVGPGCPRPPSRRRQPPHLLRQAEPVLKMMARCSLAKCH